MKGQLHQEAINVDHEEILLRIAYDLFNEMYTICRKAARYGLFSHKILLTSLPSYQWIPAGGLERVQMHLDKLLNSEKLLYSHSNSGLYELAWKEYGRLPILTSRDLIEAGYKINEAKFGIILKELKMAILDGHIKGETPQAELLWVKSAFPL